MILWLDFDESPETLEKRPILIDFPPIFRYRGYIIQNYAKTVHFLGMVLFANVHRYFQTVIKSIF